MAKEVELATLDLRYEGYRMRSPAQERKLLASIQERGVEEPLEGVDTAQGRVLLDGFKRYRCARRLKIGHVPYSSLGEDEATGVLVLLRTSNRKGLGIFEQARFVDDLCRVHGMSVAEVARTLERSKSWVHMRLGLIGEMSPAVRERILDGAFPAYAYMATLRPFMRMDDASKADVENFVGAVSGQGLSLRQIEQLAQGYFRGPAWFREQVDKGHLALPLERIAQVPEAPDGCKHVERLLLKDLDRLLEAMARVMARSQDPRLTTRAFCAQASLLLQQVLGRIGAFTRTLKELHDRTAQA